MKTILSRVALALAAASRELRDGRAAMEQHFHLVVGKNKASPTTWELSGHATKS